MSSDLSKGPLFDEPMPWFDAWLTEACLSGMSNPNACTLGTVSTSGQPSVRVVLLKEHDAQGFVFYTNLTSRKGHDLLAAKRGALNFYWRELNRQIRIEGIAKQIEDARADAYFATRHRSSQLGAWASQQSQPLASRQALMNEVERLDKDLHHDQISRPQHWSGICIVPERIEFWQEGEFRLHDRFEFVRQDASSPWRVQRIFP